MSILNFTFILNVAIFAICGLTFSSCSSIFTSRTVKEPLMKAYLAGNMPEAEKIVDKYAKSREDTGDALMWFLEQGKIKFEMGKFKESLEAFSRAEELINEFDNRAKISARDAGAETGAAFTNPNALPYRGFMYDRILLNAYKSLCYMGLGDKAGAMVEIRRMHQRQKDAREFFRSEIERAEEQIKEKKIEMSQNKTDPSAGNFSSIINSNPQIAHSNQEIQKLASKIYGDFVNPFALYLSAINYLLDGNYNSANVDFRNLYIADSKNIFNVANFATASRKIGVSLPQELSSIQGWDYPLNKDVVFVIFENGITTALKEEKVQIILPPPIPTGYSGIAYPVLETFPQPYDGLIVQAENKIYKAVEICDMDSVVASEFRELFPYIITRLVISTIIKEGAAFAAQMAAEQSGGEWAKWGTVIATSIYKYAFNTADTRCWQTLPKKYMLTHLPRPENLQLELRFGMNSQNIQLSQGKKFSLIYLRAQSHGVFNVHVFEF